MKEREAQPASLSERGRVLVLGEDTRIVLPIVRSLGRRGMEVHLAWCPRDEPVMRSRYLHAAHMLAPYRTRDDAWLNELASLLDRERFDLIIPATEAALVPIQQARGKLSDAGRFTLLNQRSFECFFDKGKTQALARSLGVPSPRGAILDKHDRLAEAVAGWTFPLAVKPLGSVDPENISGKRFVRRADDVGQLSACLALLADHEQVVVEEWFTGRGFGVEFLAQEGEVLFAFQHERLHETIGYGSTYRRSVPLDPRLLDAAKRLLQEVQYTGVGMAEFRCDPSSGKFVLLEVNARFWGSLPLAAAAGADFPAYLCELLMDGRRLFPQAYRTNVRCRNLLNDVRWMWRALSGRANADMTVADFDGWQMNSVSRGQVAVDLVRMLLAVDRTDTFSWKDPAPALAELIALAGNTCRRFTRGSSRAI